MPNISIDISSPLRKNERLILSRYDILSFLYRIGKLYYPQLFPWGFGGHVCPGNIVFRRLTILNKLNIL